jgi:hypothetical protein
MRPPASGSTIARASPASSVMLIDSPVPRHQATELSGNPLRAKRALPVAAR